MGSLPERSDAYTIAKPRRDAITPWLLRELHRFVLYAPFYAAHAIGAYEAEGIEVELLRIASGPGKAEAARTLLACGEADVMWMGPIRAS